MKRVRYPAEFKAEAVKQVTERGRGVAFLDRFAQESIAFFDKNLR
jgi:transposase-like protein